MRTLWDMKLACIFTLVAALTGCAATKSAIGSLMSPKPNQVTVMTNIEMPPTPAPIVAPAAKRSGTAAMISGGVAGAAAGAFAAASVSTEPLSIATGALAGAGVGTALGYAVHSIAD